MKIYVLLASFAIFLLLVWSCETTPEAVVPTRVVKTSVKKVSFPVYDTLLLTQEALNVLDTIMVYDPSKAAVVYLQLQEGQIYIASSQDTGYMSCKTLLDNDTIRFVLSKKNVDRISHWQKEMEKESLDKRIRLQRFQQAFDGTTFSKSILTRDIYALSTHPAFCADTSFGEIRFSNETAFRPIRRANGLIYGIVTPVGVTYTGQKGQIIREGGPYCSLVGGHAYVVVVDSVFKKMQPIFLQPYSSS